jgi:sulfur carrier protein ThiS adenylyltransferase
MPKVEALKETLERINPYEKITVFHEKITRENIDLFFGECDLIIEAFDRADQKTMLIQEGIRMGKTVIAASGVAGIGEADRIVIRKVNEKLYIVGDFEREARPGEGLMAPRVMIAAAKQADLAVEILLDRLQKV